MRYRRPLLGVVLAAIGVTAVMGLYAVIVPDFGDLQEKILATSAAVSGASIVVLACAPAWERRLVFPVPQVGAVASLGAFTLIVIGIWLEPSHDAYWKTMGTVLVAGLWGALVSLLVLAPLAPRFRWSFIAAAGLTLLLAALGVAALWAEPDSDPFGRIVGGVAVLAAAAVVTVPVLSRAGRAEIVIAESSGGFCPRCGARVTGAAPGGPAACGRCGARFRVEFVE